MPAYAGMTGLKIGWGSYVRVTGGYTPIIPSKAATLTVISQIPLMVSRIFVKSEDLFERQRVTAA